MKKSFKCAYCTRKVFEYPATSRRDNTTEICSNCALKEALMDFAKREVV